MRGSSLLVAVLLGCALLAFWPQYLSRPFRSIDGYTHLHAALGLAWLLLLIVQPLAVRRRWLALHRAAGRASYLLAPLFALSSLLLAHFRFASMDEARFEAEAFSLFLPFHAVLLFAIAWALGLAYRRIPAAHGRFMLATALPLLDPVFGRILFFYFPPLPALPLYQAITFVVTDLVAAALVFSFRGTAVARRALAALLGTFVGIHVLWFTFAPTGTFFAFAAWFRSLPLT